MFKSFWNFWLYQAGIRIGLEVTDTPLHFGKIANLIVSENLFKYRTYSCCPKIDTVFLVLNFKLKESTWIGTTQEGFVEAVRITVTETGETGAKKELD